MRRLSNVAPSEVLLEEFLKPMGITAYRLAKETKIPQTRVSQIIRNRRKISADTALRFSKFFGTSPNFWLGLQNDYDIEEERRHLSRILESISSYKQ
jgi:addiction module HigA family antidote